MRKKIIGIVLVVIAIVVGCITYKVYANNLQKEKENLQLTIAENNVKIAVVGKYTSLLESYKSRISIHTSFIIIKIITKDFSCQ